MKNLKVLIVIILTGHISVAQLSHIPAYSQASFATHGIDLSKEVGLIGGKATVNNSGAATYYVPIEIPSGIKGIQPNLGLSYNSQGGDGIAGYRWNLAGMSCISRGNKKLVFNDLEVSAPNFNKDDAFYLDGTRLMHINNVPYGTDGSEYGKEIEDFSRIIAHGSNTDGPDWFEVITKQGIIYEYGNTEAHELAALARENFYSGVTKKWWLTRIRDCTGNAVEFVYVMNQKQQLLNEIYYTRNGSTAPPHKIKFNYEASSRKFPAFDGEGIHYTYAKIISSIEVYTNNSKQLEYELHYSNTGPRELLSKIEKHSYRNGSKKSLNPVIFRYQESTPSNTHYFNEVSETGNFSSGNKQIIPGDFDGDGRTDLYVGLITEIDGYFAVTSYELWSQTSYGNWAVKFSGSITNSGSDQSMQARQANMQFSAVDFNGDGKHDIMRIISGTGTNGMARLVRTETNIMNSTNTGFTAINNNPPATYKYLNADGKSLQTGDFNGDGRTDYLLFLANTNGDFNTYVTFGGTTSVNVPVNLSGASGHWATPWMQNSHGIFVLDINGDGKDELLVLTNGAAKFYEVSKDAGNQQKLTQIASHNTLSATGLEFAFGDFNADGKQDIVSYKRKTPAQGGMQLENLIVHYSHGKGYQQQPVLRPNIGFTNLAIANFQVVPADFNGDAVTDIAIGIDGIDVSIFPPVRKTEIQLYINDGEHNFYSNISPTYIWDFGTSVQGFVEGSALPVDFDGDGIQEITWQGEIFQANGNSNANDKFIAYGKHINEDFGNLVEIKNSHNIETKISYQRLTYFGPGAIAGLNLQTASSHAYGYPTLKRSFNVKVASSIETEMDLSPAVFNKTEMFYGQPVMNSSGRGFLGFDYLERKNTNSNKHIKITSKPSLQRGLLLQEQSQLNRADNGALQSTNQTQINVTPLSHNRLWFKTVSVENTDWLIHLKDRTEFTNYDSYGNLYHKTDYLGHHLANNTWLEKVVTSNPSDFASVCGANPSLPKAIFLTKERSGKQAINKTTYIQNSPTLGPEIITTYPGTAKEVTITSSNPDQYGHWQTTEVTSNGLPPKITHLKYGFGGRFITETTNELGFKEKFDYNATTGFLRWQEDIRGNKMYYTFDDFGRIKSKSYPQGISTNYFRYFDVQTGTGNSTVSADRYTWIEYQNTTASPTQKTFFDRLGRTRKIEVGRDDSSKPLTKVFTYIANGLLKSETETFEQLGSGTNPTSPQITSYAYDNQLRVVSTLSGQQSVSKVYSNDQITHQYINTVTKANGNTSTGYTDGSGKTLKVEDQGGGTLTYDYDSWGNLEKVFQDNKKMTEMTYSPINGEQLTLWDVDAGTTSYTYDAYGQLTTQTNPLGHTETMIYDVAGRLVEKTDANGEGPHYLYYSAGDGIGQVSHELPVTTGPTKLYDYDNLGRLSHMETTDPETIAAEYSYNNTGRLEQTDYNTGISVKNEYDYLGRLLVVKGIDNTNQGTTTNLWQRQAESHPMGLQNNFQLGNGHQCEIGIANGFQSYFKVNNPNIYEAWYTWDLTNSNLTSRHFDGGSRMGKDNFTYQDARLRTMESDDLVPGQGTTYDFREQYYDASGNVTELVRSNGSSLDLGRYKNYGGDGHDVGLIDNDDDEIPLDVQTVSYTLFNEPDEIEEGIFKAKFTYDATHVRRSMLMQENGADKYRRDYYPGFNLEATHKLDNGDKWYAHYVPLPDQAGAVIVSKETPDGNSGGSGGSDPNGSGDDNPGSGKTDDNAGDPNAVYEPTTEIFYYYTDYLGSIKTVTDDGGNIIHEQNFDAWGRRRDPATLAYLPSNHANATGSLADNLPWFHRGYTGHEHLSEFEIIHMNGRLYDPEIHRMFQPDNHVQSPSNSQNYNRYSYALNNPLKYIDPDGEFLGTALLAGMPAINEGLYWAGKRMSGDDDYQYNTNYASVGLHGENPAHWKNQDGVVKGKNGRPVGPNGEEYSNFGDISYDATTGTSYDANGNPYNISQMSGFSVNVTFGSAYVNVGGDDYYKGEYIKSTSVSYNEGAGSAEADPLFRYAGDQKKYPGSIVIETTLMQGGAVTLPPFVFTRPGNGSRENLMHHEHGHNLQYGILSAATSSLTAGYALYLLAIGVPSILSADKANSDANHFHQGTFTEKSANQLEYWFNGQPNDWDHNNYPVYQK